MESRQVGVEENTCLREENGIQASRRGREYLPARQK
jgi:hypothetical protein